MNSIKICWYLIYTKPRHEKKVVENLNNLKVQYFLPTMRTLRTFGQRKKYVDLPLFPSYIFVKLESIQHYIESLNIPGVLRYVRTGNKISEVSETIIDNLKAINSVKNNIQVSSEQFNKGSILNINVGPFTGFSCEIIEHKGKNKILVRINLLQRNVLMDLPQEYLAQ